MIVCDSRRLTGPNIVTRAAGAVLDLGLEPGDDVDTAIVAWRRAAGELLDAVGWDDRPLTHRRFHGGVSLVIEGPIDGLYAATEVNELAWRIAAERLGRGGAEPVADLVSEIERLKSAIAEESKPALGALRRAAAEHRVAFLWDDDVVSVGMGQGSRQWPSHALPEPAAVPWSAIRDFPVALITGTNGKTTTVRLIRAMAEAAGHTIGLSSTDGCWVGNEEIGEGDFSGPGGARKVLRDPRIDLALLETARGGMLRRGLGVERADVALITNVAEDHLGEWGIHDLDELTDTKLIVAQGAEHLVVNADDRRLRQRVPSLGLPVSWFALEPASLRDLSSARTARAKTCAALLEDDQLVLHHGAGREVMARLDKVPITLGGAARHNIANALAAVAVAHRLGLPFAAIRRGLLEFDGSAASNPGRLNRFDLGDAVALVDFAHNPHGMAALLDTARALPAKRRCVLVGQAGDRDDDAIRQLPRLVWQRLAPERVVIKELPDHLRGRPPGEVPALIDDELRRLGASDVHLDHAPDEVDAVDRALAWARPGDLLLLLIHEQRQDVLARLHQLETQGWKPGEPLPSPPALVVDRS